MLSLLLLLLLHTFHCTTLIHGGGGLWCFLFCSTGFTGQAFIVVKACAERMKVSDSGRASVNNAEVSEEDRVYHAEKQKAEADLARELAEAESERAREQQRE